MEDVLDRLRSALADRYDVQEEVGRGGMATVYLAVDRKHSRRVAIKVLPPSLADGLGAERFLREVATAARLRHPHILPLFDSGETEGLLYYVMPFVEGRSLRDRLERETRLPVDEAVRIAREVGDALRYAHDNGVLHRDIKPGNIMLDSRHAVVADFGVARAITEAGGSRLTATGAAVGTPDYMSPEQASGDALDERSDLYSLGCVLYEMLAGEPPHTGPTPQAVIARRLSEPPAPLRGMRPDVPEEVSRALERALATPPDDRFRDVAEFLEALGQGAEAVPSGRPGRRRALVRVLAGSAIVALVAASVVVLGRRGEDGPSAGLDPAPAVAVLPFQVVGQDLDYWREGMVHLLSLDLEGISGLRKLDPQVVLHTLRTVTGRDSQDVTSELALEVGRRLGARYAVTGTVVQLGPDARLTAQAHDVAFGGPRGAPVQVDGPADSVLVLVDRLALDLLRREAIPPGTKRPPVSLGRITTGSLPAFKAYIAGEQHARNTRWDDAARQFQRAIELDSTFARAHYRLAVAYDWTQRFSLGAEVAARAARLASRLPERDSLLLVGYARTDPAAIPTLERLTARYPDDVDGWYALGEAYLHFGGVALHPDERFRAAFERALALTPHYGESYIHLLEDAVARRDGPRAKQLVAGFQAADPLHPPCPGYRVVVDLAWGSADERARAAADLDTMAYDDLEDCAWTVISASPAALERAERSDLARVHLQDSWAARMHTVFRMLQARTMQGQVRAAYRVLATAGRNPLIAADAARFAMMFHLSGFPDSAAANAAAAVMAESGAFDDHFWLGARAAAGERWPDVERARRVLQRLGDSLLAGGDSIHARFARADADALGAYVGLVRGDLGRLPDFEGALLRMAPWGFRSESPAYYLRYRVGQLLFDRGLQPEAERYFRSFYPYQWMYLVPAQYYLGRIYEAQGRPEAAAARYRLFVQWWDRADPALRPWVDDGRAALARVTAERPAHVTGE